MIKLKLCPFCGHEPGMYRYAANESYIIWCEKCGVKTDYYDTEEEAAIAWNKRYNEERNDYDE